jgi:hypothetical protein
MHNKLIEKRNKQKRHNAAQKVMPSLGGRQNTTQRQVDDSQAWGNDSGTSGGDESGGSSGGDSGGGSD